MQRIVETRNRRPPPMAGNDREADEIARRALWARFAAALSSPLQFPPDGEELR